MTQGVLAEIWWSEQKLLDVLVIGAGVPKIHSADRVPVYQVAVHAEGTPQVLKDGRTMQRLLAYPAAWAAPGEHFGCVLKARHELLKWTEPVPVFDGERRKV